jgi:nicotinate-nucleotide adenylyltransferase
MRIAILGGRFDPPHNWHSYIVQNVLKSNLNINQVWLIPDYQNAFRKSVASYEDRITMLSFLETDKIMLSTLSSEDKKVTYTIDIVKKLPSGNDYFWIIGSDLLEELPTWKDYQLLKKMIKFIVIPRKDYLISDLPDGFQKLESINYLSSNISSSMIRERIKKRLSIKNLVLPDVEEYIKKYNLYK